MIKELLKEDLNDEFFKVYYEGFLYHYKHRKDIFKYRTIDELKEYVFKQLEQGIKFIGYYKEDELLGYYSYEIKEKLTRYIWIDELVVKEEYRGQGYGTILMNNVKEIRDKENASRIELNCWSFNEKAINLYKKIGYTEQRVILELKEE